jgi:hypothetical protein
MPELSAAESTLLLVVISLALAAMLVWACHDAKRPPPQSYLHSLLIRRAMRYWKR